MPARRDGLARRRAAMGFTQESLAEHLRIERSTVGRWERGTMTPQPWNRPDLAKALDLSHDALADLLGPDPGAGCVAARMGVLDGEHNVAAELTGSDSRQAGQACLLEPPWSITGTMQVLHKLAGGSVDRRGFLIITGAPLAGLGDRWASALVRLLPLPTALPEPPHARLSTTALDRLDHRLAKHTATPRLRALLASRKERAYAKAGDAMSCYRALNDAERRLDTTTLATAEPDWIYFFDEAELAAQAAACWVDLRQPAKARPLIDNALSSMNPQYVRDRTIYHVRSAEAHLHVDDLDLACGDLHTAADLACQTGSVRSIHTIRSARKAMSRYDRDPRVQKLDRHLAYLAWT